MACAVKVGLEVLRDDLKIGKDWGRVGLVCNQASVALDFVPSWQILHQRFGKNLTALFGPQHGFEATVQDNMIETSHAFHRFTGVPVYSLYSETREPTPEMLRDVDTIVIDLQITGCRVYTFKYTIAGCLRAAKKLGKKVVVLDRPNPLGGEVIEGRILDKDVTSFVGQYPIPMRHGMTAAEAARFFNGSIGAELETVALQGWDPKAYWGEIERPWIITSPNLPTIDPVYVYPGTVIFEGTNVSEGRGTGLPFQFIGAPYVKDSQELVKRIKEVAQEFVGGIVLRPTSFEPTSQKWKGETCQGFQIHVIDYRQIRSFKLSLAILYVFKEMGGSNFQWKDPPYEYDYNTLPIKLILGSAKSPERLESGKFSVNDSFWNDGLKDYQESVQNALLYDRDFISIGS